MTQVMKGVRVLEVAQFTFVPAAGAILADWGADVVKIEHPVRGDAQRGFINIGGMKINPARNPGRDIGSSTVKNCVTREAPRFLDASSTRGDGG